MIIIHNGQQWPALVMAKKKEKKKKKGDWTKGRTKSIGHLNEIGHIFQILAVRRLLKVKVLTSLLEFHHTALLIDTHWPPALVIYPSSLVNLSVLKGAFSIESSKKAERIAHSGVPIQLPPTDIPM